MGTQRKRVVQLAACAVGLAAVCAALTAPGAVGRPPSCAISNDRNHKGYDGLQAAVDAAKSGDTLEIKGTCVGSTSLDRDITLKGVVNNAFPGTPTLDAAGHGRVLTLTAGKATVHNLVITNGSASGEGDDGNGGRIFISDRRPQCSSTRSCEATAPAPDHSGAASRPTETCC